MKIAMKVGYLTVVRMPVQNATLMNMRTAPTVSFVTLQQLDTEAMVHTIIPLVEDLWLYNRVRLVVAVHPNG